MKNYDNKIIGKKKNEGSDPSIWGHLSHKDIYCKENLLTVPLKAVEELRFKGLRAQKRYNQMSHLQGHKQNYHIGKWAKISVTLQSNFEI